MNQRSRILKLGLGFWLLQNKAESAWTNFHLSSCASLLNWAVPSMINCIERRFQRAGISWASQLGGCGLNIVALFGLQLASWLRFIYMTRWLHCLFEGPWWEH